MIGLLLLSLFASGDHIDFYDDGRGGTTLLYELESGETHRLNMKLEGLKNRYLIKEWIDEIDSRAEIGSNPVKEDRVD